MLKFGIYNIDQLRKGNYRNFLGGVKKISASLLSKINALPDADAYREKIFFELTDDSGAYKRTYEDRFKDFDSHVLELIEKNIRSGEAIYFHDAGVSSAKTAKDFFLKIKGICNDIEYFASDYDPYIDVVEYRGFTCIFSSANKELIEITRPPFVFPAKRTESVKFYPLNHLIRKYLWKTLVPKVTEKYAQGELKSVERICLFSPDAIDLEKEDHRFRLGQHNLLEPSKLGKKIHCFRAMNVLMLGYFVPDQIPKILSEIHEALLPGGLFILGSNQESNTIVNGGVYRKTASGFELLWNSGEGASISNFIQAFDIG